MAASMIRAGPLITMKRTLTLAVLLLAGIAGAQQVSNPKASLVDVAKRRAELAHTADPRTKAALASLAHCTALPFVTAPTGRMIIPPHYLSGGHGPINPEEEKVTHTYNEFERRVAAGMNQWLATGDVKEAQCAQAQIDAWAKAETLLNYDPKESSQAWFQVEWTLSSVAISESVLVNEPSLPPDEVKRDMAWMNRVAHQTVEFDRAGKQTNNHHYWRGLAATAVGVVSKDDELFAWGTGVYKQAIDEIDKNGAFPQEMARHERAIHYQSFALQPLAPLAALAERQGMHLFSYKSPSGETIQDAVDFLGRALADRGILKQYASEEQLVDADAPDFFSFAEFCSHFRSQPLPPAILEGLNKPTFASRVGGNITVLDGYVPGARE
jgi:poly(beta-D-mannuronate) lyase